MDDAPILNEREVWPTLAGVAYLEAHSVDEAADDVDEAG